MIISLSLVDGRISDQYQTLEGLPKGLRTIRDLSDTRRRVDASAQHTGSFVALSFCFSSRQC